MNQTFTWSIPATNGVYHGWVYSNGETSTARAMTGAFTGGVAQATP
jgi:hypothetical protein